jgi:hypothetical protein
MGVSFQQYCHASGFLPFSFLGFVNSKNPQKPSQNSENPKTLETQKREAFLTETPLRVLMQNSQNSSKLTIIYYGM